MKKFDKDDLKKNIKETLNQKDKKKKKDSKLDDSLTVNGNGTLHHNSQNSLDRLSPYNRSPMGPSPSVSIPLQIFVLCLFNKAFSTVLIIPSHYITFH